MQNAVSNWKDVQAKRGKTQFKNKQRKNTLLDLGYQTYEKTTSCLGTVKEEIQRQVFGSWEEIRRKSFGFGKKVKRSVSPSSVLPTYSPVTLIGTPVLLIIHVIIQSCGSNAIQKITQIRIKSFSCRKKIVVRIALLMRGVGEERAEWFEPKWTLCTTGVIWTESGNSLRVKCCSGRATTTEGPSPLHPPKKLLNDNNNTVDVLVRKYTVVHSVSVKCMQYITKKSLYCYAWTQFWPETTSRW